MAGRGSARFWMALLRCLPRNGISRLAGRLASLRLPPVLRAPVFVLFGRLVGVDFSEVRDPLVEHASLQAFFTRALRDGVRPIDPAADAVVAPCDGAWGEAGRVHEGLLLQLKGRPYRLADLLGDSELASRFEGGCYATFYLSPRDYHRFHAPCALRVLRALHVPGTLWPVNRLGLEGVDGIFAENERIVAHMQLGPERAREVDLCLVAVGATMVGRVRLRFDEDLSTNRRGAPRARHDYGAGVPLAPGEEWGRFEFGSTLVLVSRPGTLELDLQPAGSPLRLGRRIGRLGAAAGRGGP